MSMRQPLGELSSGPASRSDHGLVLNAVENRIRLGLPAAAEAFVWKRTLTSPQRQLLQAARTSASDNGATDPAARIEAAR
jgi:hypothetical protein